MTTFETTHRNKFIAAVAEAKESPTMDDLISAIEETLTDLKAMRDAGIKVASAGDDYWILQTTDKKVARRFGMEEAEHCDEYED